MVEDAQAADSFPGIVLGAAVAGTALLALVCLCVVQELWGGPAVFSFPAAEGWLLVAFSMAFLALGAGLVWFSWRLLNGDPIWAAGPLAAGAVVVLPLLASPRTVAGDVLLAVVLVVNVSLVWLCVARPRPGRHRHVPVPAPLVPPPVFRHSLPFQERPAGSFDVQVRKVSGQGEPPG